MSRERRWRATRRWPALRRFSRHLGCCRWRGWNDVRAMSAPLRTSQPPFSLKMCGLAARWGTRASLTASLLVGRYNRHATNTAHPRTRTHESHALWPINTELWRHDCSIPEFISLNFRSRITSLWLNTRSQLLKSDFCNSYLSGYAILNCLKCFLEYALLKSFKIIIVLTYFKNTKQFERCKLNWIYFQFYLAVRHLEHGIQAKLIHYFKYNSKIK